MDRKYGDTYNILFIYSFKFCNLWYEINKLPGENETRHVQENCKSSKVYNSLYFL